MEDKIKFEYTYSAPTETERKEIESIRKQYEPKSQTEVKLARLRRLNGRVNGVPKTAALCVGTIGAMLFGLGMAMAIEWGLIAWGVVLGVIGVAVASTAYPVYKRLLARCKERYATEIITLSDELLCADGEKA